MEQILNLTCRMTNLFLPSHKRSSNVFSLPHTADRTWYPSYVHYSSQIVISHRTGYKNLCFAWLHNAKFFLEIFYCCKLCRSKLLKNFQHHFFSPLFSGPHIQMYWECNSTLMDFINRLEVLLLEAVLNLNLDSIPCVSLLGLEKCKYIVRAKSYFSWQLKMRRCSANKR